MSSSFPGSLTPSPARLYTPTIIPPGVPSPTLVLAPKSSAEILDYTVDFSAGLAGTGDSILSASLLASSSAGAPYPLVSVWNQVSGTQVVLMLASGQPGQTVAFAVEVITSQGRSIVQPLQITITSLTPATAPPQRGTVLMINGASLTVNNTAVTITPGKGEIVAAPLTTLETGDWIAISRDVAGVQTLYRVDGGALGNSGGVSSASITGLSAQITSVSSATSGASVLAGSAMTVASGASVQAGSALNIASSASFLAGSAGAVASGGSVIATSALAIASAASVQAGSAAGVASGGVITATSAFDVANSASNIASGASVQAASAVTTANGAMTLASGAMTSSAGDGRYWQQSADLSGAKVIIGSSGTTLAKALGAAQGNSYLPLNPTDVDNLPTITAPSNSKFGASYAFNMADNEGHNILNVGCVNGYGLNWFAVNSQNGSPIGLLLTDYMGNRSTLAAHTSSDGVADIYSTWYAANSEYGEGGFRWICKDNGSSYWKLSATKLGNSNSWLTLTAGTSDLSAWQSVPLVSFDPVENVAHFTSEPIVTAYTASTFSNLPPSPVAWQRLVVIDRRIGSGTLGVMAMWNPNAKIWTGLAGETLTT